MPMVEDPVARLMAGLAERQIGYLRFELPDMHGISGSKTVAIDRAEDYPLLGLNFYGGVLGLDTSSHAEPGSRLHGDVNFADQVLIPDPDTLRTIPWSPGTGSVLCTGYWDVPDRPQRASPRWAFGQLVAEANRLGYDVLTGHEYEYYLLRADTKQRLYEGMLIFHTVRNQHVPFLDQLVPQLQALGIDVITHNCEYAGSQFETVYDPGLNLAGPDRAFVFKNGLKELAHRNG